MNLRSGWLLLAAWLASSTATAEVVINEVMYHPPDDHAELQFIELYNAGTARMDLSGWSFHKGIKLTFTNGTMLDPGAYAVACANRAALLQHYGPQIPVLGEFTGHLKHGGERIELADAAGRVVDAMKFSDHSPWPLAADGKSASLERICATAPSNLPENWTSSRLPATERATGTPGRRNDSQATNLPPMVRAVQFTAAVPGEPTPVNATVEDSDGVRSVTLRYRIIDNDPTDSEQSLPMSRMAGDEHSGAYTAAIPPQTSGRLIRFQIEAHDAVGGVRRFPADHELRPALSTFVASNTNTSAIGFYQLRQLGSRAQSGPSRFNNRRPDNTLDPTQGKAALLYLPAGGGAPVTFDFIHLIPRQGGWKIHLPKDRPLDGMSTVNVIFEGRARWALAEALSYEVFRACGVPTPKSGHVRVWLDGRLLGYHLTIGQPNKTFVREHELTSGGNLYKLLWYGHGLVGQHEKKTNLRTGHADLEQLIAGLKPSKDEAQWQFIRENFAVDEFINYYAANQCIQNWDGFFNNYFAYHEPNAGGKWWIFPWDEDKTWGDFNDAPTDYPWVSMPLTFGMKGDQEPKGSGLPHQSHPWGSVTWWRPGGWFSGPLLANPQFRERFLTRLKGVCETVFTEDKMLPVINAMERRLQPEVRIRAIAAGEDPKLAVTEFRHDMDSFRHQLKSRRAFLLSELAKAK